MTRSSKECMRIDEREAQYGVSHFAASNDIRVGPSIRLAYLYGARAALVHGGVPLSALPHLNEMIAYWERNRDPETADVERMGDGTEKEDNSGS